MCFSVGSLCEADNILKYAEIVAEVAFHKPAPTYREPNIIEHHQLDPLV
jgi:hypothetical protein